ncbi:DnaJ C-terminal domain-containing protein [Arenicella xantha]|uniref:Curved DNA-binding protein n=1 Tax=Arenicella xantha TaxID=644221 RepID=A0A395JKD5_9GAMM|nr:DnaJ C-terminal domain-containing protein [Arenicella xantha]RBP51243.1 curved DNA-binding protein [Arenicella xantha]
MEYKDYYQILGVERSATGDQIKSAYRRLARKYHPDVSKEADAEARFKEMKEAYEVLKDADNRAAYDKFGKDWKAGQDFQPPPDWAQQTRRPQGDFDQTAGYSDFFDSLFGARGGADFGGQSRGNMRMDGQDVNARITVSLEDAFSGATRQISIDLPEMDSSGRMVNRRRKLNVKIPKGILAGQRIRLESQGGAGMGAGAQSGDLYLQVDLAPHPIYEPRERDIYVVLPITPWEAALGRTVKAPTLAGPVDLKIPAGSQAGKKLRLKGRGLPGKTPGDEYVELKIVMPATVDDKAKSLYEELERTQTFNPRSSLGV